MRMITANKEKLGDQTVKVPGTDKFKIHKEISTLIKKDKLRLAKQKKEAVMIKEVEAEVKPIENPFIGTRWLPNNSDDEDMLNSMKESQETLTDQQKDEETEVESCCKKLESIKVDQTASQPLGRLPSRPTVESDTQFFVSDSTEENKDPKPIEFDKVVFETLVPFARKRTYLSIYTFDKPSDDDIGEEVKDTLIYKVSSEEEYNAGKESCKKTSHMKRRFKLRKAKSKEECSIAKLTKKLRSSKRPLKCTHWNSDKRSR